ncbi:MAG: L,D-transpeptidase family protein [Tatlockia sp.]|nr:L,D-transpeptidase family protein [Tatlockia sp.]
MIKAGLQIYLLCLCLFCLNNSWSATYVMPLKGDLVGEIQYGHPEISETLADVGLRYEIGYYEMLRANPRVDPTRILSPATGLIIPSQFILPPGSRLGIVINLAEYRLYYFPPNDNVVITMPVGIGREGWSTPLGLTKVIQKERDPVWRPTALVRKEAKNIGSPIPHVFPPGEGNPLGRHILRLGWPTYLIHGTNRSDGIGARVSAGCIRMRPEDIEQLFALVSVGTPVRVLNEPLKLGYHKGKLFIEIHPPLIEQKKFNLKERVHKHLNGLVGLKINNKRINEELNYPTGLPKAVT